MIFFIIKMLTFVGKTYIYCNKFHSGTADFFTNDVFFSKLVTLMTAFVFMVASPLWFISIFFFGEKSRHKAISRFVFHLKLTLMKRNYLIFGLQLENVKMWLTYVKLWLTHVLLQFVWKITKLSCTRKFCQLSKTKWFNNLF